MCDYLRGERERERGDGEGESGAEENREQGEPAGDLFEEAIGAAEESPRDFRALRRRCRIDDLLRQRKTL